RANQDNSPRINRGTGYDNQKAVNVVGARENVGTLVVQKSRIQCYNCKEYGHVSRECQKPKRVKDAAYHKEKMLLCKQEKAGVQLNAEQANWKDDTDDESEDQELEAHYMYMAQIQEVTPDLVDNFGPIFDDEPMHKVQNNNDNYNVFAMENKHPEQHESSNHIYLVEQGDTKITIDSLDICYNRDQDDQDDTDDLDQERDLLASLIQKLNCEIDDSKNRNKFLESSNKALVDKLKGEIEDFKTKNKSLESSNNHFKEANNELSKTNQLMFKDLKKFQAELDKYNDVNYASKVEIDCAKAKGDLMSYKIDFEKSSNAYTRQINDLNQTISDMKKRALCNQAKPSPLMSQVKEAQIKLYKTQFCKNLKFLKKAQRANPRLYDIGCYNDNLALMLAPESDKTIRLDKESRSKLSDLIRPFDYDKLNNLYDLTRQPMAVPISTREPKHNVNQSVATSRTVKFGNGQITPILGYGDLVQGTITIKRVYYVKGLNHNLFSVGQFCDADLEVAFRKSTCYIRNLKGNDLLIGSRGTDLYSITLQDSTTPNPICLMVRYIVSSMVMASSPISSKL
ncbi:integrase, catalytic region, zinc finger, CCHC-type containing protein, partial [Tanacetum coccineum]